MLKELGGATLIGPMLVGLTHSVQICPLGAKDSDVVNMAALAACCCDRGFPLRARVPGVGFTSPTQMASMAPPCRGQADSAQKRNGIGSQ